MLALLKGTVICSTSDQIIVDIGGIGYEAYYAKNIPTGSNVSLFTALIIRENSQTLYAFDSLNERNFFYLLLKVKGIGPRHAFNLITNLGIDIISNAIKTNDSAVLMSVSGIGKKSASQIILDLKDTNMVMDDNLSEILMAAKSLGISEDRVIPIYKQLTTDAKNLSSSDLVKLVLQRIN